MTNKDKLLKLIERLCSCQCNGFQEFEGSRCIGIGGYHPFYEDPIDDILNLLRDSDKLMKNHIYHMEGSCFNHTVLVLKEMMSIEDHDELDLVIALMHDLGEYEFLMDRIKLDTEMIIVNNDLESTDWDEIAKYLYDVNVSKLTPKIPGCLKGIKIDQIKNKGHEIISATTAFKILSEIFITKISEKELNLEKVKTIEFCIRWHMVGHFLDKMTHPNAKKMLRKLYKSPHYPRLRRIWLADINGCINDNPKITLNDLDEKVMFALH